MTEKKFEIPPAKLTEEDQEFLGDEKKIPPIQRRLIEDRMRTDQFKHGNETGKNLSAAETFSAMMTKQTEQEIEERSNH